MKQEDEAYHLLKFVVDHSSRGNRAQDHVLQEQEARHRRLEPGSIPDAGPDDALLRMCFGQIVECSVFHSAHSVGVTTCIHRCSRLSNLT